MKIYFTDQFVLPLPDGHRFPMAKYSALRERVAARRLGDLEIPPPASDDALRLVHTANWVERVRSGKLTPKEQRQIGFPWSPQMVERSRRSVGATVAAARAALRQGYAANLAGGTHHGYAGHGEGFCVFNDVAVAIRVLQREQLITRALVIDLDVHQGNGTAHLFAEDPEVFTLSIHGRGNYPFRKERGDLDLALPDGTADADYLQALEGALQRADEALQPDLIFYLAGADPFVGDTLGRLSLSKSGLKQRDRMVFDFADQRALPVTVVMAGGYAEDLADIVDIHESSVAEAARRVSLRGAHRRSTGCS